MGGGLRGAQSGQATTEVAISSIVLLSLLLGLLALARGFYFTVRLQDAAREGARVGATYDWATNTYPNLQTTANITNAVNDVLISTGMTRAADPGVSGCPATKDGNAQHNPSYTDAAFPTDAGQPLLYICYAGGAPFPATSPQGQDLLVVVLYRYGLISGFLQNQLGASALEMVGTYHARVP